MERKHTEEMGVLREQIDRVFKIMEYLDGKI